MQTKPVQLGHPGVIGWYFQLWRNGLQGEHHALMCGRRFRTFNVVDDFNREALAIEIDLNLPAPRIIRVLDRLVAKRPRSSKWSRHFFEPLE